MKWAAMKKWRDFMSRYRSRWNTRSAIADSVEQQAVIAADQEAFVKRRLEGDVYAAVSSGREKF